MRTRWCWCCGEPVFCRLNRTAPFWTWYYYIPTSRNSDDCSWERICTHCYVDLVENRANQFEARLTSLYGRLNMLDDITELTRERRRSEQMLKQLINTLLSVIDRRDPFSAHHSTRVAEVSLAIAGEMNTPELVGKTAEIAGSLMYLGKIFVPPELLTKTGNLLPEERDMLANSYLVSADLLRSGPFNGPVVDTIEQMGEKWDGTGPLNLHGEEIILPARVLAVANAFVGMISPRAYRGAMTFEKVSRILLGESNSKFDRKPISALINFLDNRGGTEAWAHYRERSENAD